MTRTPAISIALLLAACTPDLAGLASPDDVSSGDVGVEDAAIGRTDTEPTETCTAPASGVDTDGDGLFDLIEDADRDCRLDEQETDPAVADTDGDGLDDGEEDLDRNGVWDRERGEFDPRNPDTDGDGVLDGSEPLASVCRAGEVGLMSDWLFAVAGGRLAVPPPFEVFAEGADTGAWILGPDDDAAALLASVDEPVPWDGLRAAIVSGFSAHGVASGGGWEHRDHRGYVTEIDIDSDDPIPVIAVVAGVGSALGAFAAPPERDAPGFEHFVVRVDVRPDGPGARLSIAVVAHGEDGSVASAEQAHFFARVGADAVAPRDTARTRAMCESLEPVPPAPVVDVVLVLDTAAPMVPLDFALVERAAELIATRAEIGFETRVWLVGGDAHETGQAVPGEPITRPEDLRARVSGMELGEADQRLWAHARVALEHVRSRQTEETPLWLVLAAMREDSGFREGEYNGLDGHPFAEALPDGGARDALTEFYADIVGSSGARLVTVAVGSTDGPRDDCAFGDDTSVESEFGQSYRDVALLAGGRWIDACGRSPAETVQSAFVGVDGASPTVRLAHPPIAATLRLAAGAIEDPGDTPAASAIRGDAVSLGPGGWLDLGVAYLYWETIDPAAPRF